MSDPLDNTEDNQTFAPPPAEDLSAIIPGFEITSFLAQGGMGAIYKGEQTKLERPVAIKILPHSYGGDFNYTERFEIEAKAMAKLSHNNIVSVFDYGETSDEQFLFFVMEYIEGSNLHQLLLNGPLEVAQAINVLRQVCSGLQYAHEHGIIHRDIKPSNILINQRGTVKMADFGLAKVARERGTSPSGADDEGNIVMGTPEYIAPEALIEGVEIDYRADIYSVGVLTYEVLTGKLPGGGSFVPPSQARPGVDRRFDEIVRMAMLEDRGARYQQVNEIDRVLAEIAKAPKLLTGKGKKGPGARPPRPLAGKAHLPVGSVPKKTSPKKPVVPVIGAAVKPEAAPKKKIAIPTAKPAQVTARRPTAARSVASRTKARYRQAPQKDPKTAMVAMGVGFVILILIGALLLWVKSQSQTPAEKKKPPKTPPPPAEKSGDGDFFGVPLSSAGHFDGFRLDFPSSRES